MKIIKEETKRCTLVKDRLQDLFRAARTVDENQIKMQNDDDDESCRCEAQIKEMRWIFILYIDFIFMFLGIWTLSLSSSVPLHWLIGKHFQLHRITPNQNDKR